MKIRKIIFVLTFFIVTFLASCAKITKEEDIDVKATIIGTYHRPSCVIPIRSGDITTFITQPAVYKVTVEYEGIEYKISDRNFYEECKDKIGETVKVVCHKIYYDNGDTIQGIDAPNK